MRLEGSMGSKTYFVTGATGLIGKNLVRRLHHEGHHIIVLVRDEVAARSLFSGLERVEFINGSLEAPVFYNGVIDIIIHSAAPTDSRFFIESPVETAESIVIGTSNMLKLAREKQVESMIYLSSMEVYGLPVDGKPIDEDQYYPINSMSVRSSYPIAKLMAENLCTAYHSEYGVPVKSVRLAQVIGEGLIEGDNRAISQFVRSAIQGHNINLATEGESTQSYVSLQDALDALLLIAGKGTNGTVYNVADESMYFSIKELAEIVARTISTKNITVNTSTDENAKQYANHRTLNLDAGKVRGLGWSPSVGIEEALRRLAGI